MTRPVTALDVSATPLDEAFVAIGFHQLGGEDCSGGLMDQHFAIGQWSMPFGLM
jgi:hypothetical protein